MAPKLYSANVEDVGKPVAASVEKTAKPERTEKQIAAAEKRKLKRKAETASKEVAPEVAAPAEKVEDPIVPVDEKVKKPRKRVQKNVSKSSPPPSVTGSENLETLINDAISNCSKESKEECEKPAKKAKIAKTKIVRQEVSPAPSVDDNEPPKWFKAYIMGVKEEQALMSKDKIPKKQVRFSANQEANEKWNQPTTRHRINKSVDHHLQSLYSMVFPNRKF